MATAAFFMAVVGFMILACIGDALHKLHKELLDLKNLAQSLSTQNNVLHGGQIETANKLISMEGNAGVRQQVLMDEVRLHAGAAPIKRQGTFQQRHSTPKPRIVPELERFEAGEWLVWHGGPPPPVRSRVEIIFRDAKTGALSPGSDAFADAGTWEHRYTPSDIIAYRKA